jgi:glucose-6-phosphate 1-dehydrogenase
MVIFGAGGDLTKRLVVPALYNLSRTKVLPKKFVLIGVDLAVGTADGWRDHLHDTLESFVGDPDAEFNVDRIDQAAWKRLAARMSYVQGGMTKPELYENISAALLQAEKAHKTQGNVIFYLAVADRFFGTVVEQLGKAKLTVEDKDKAEKPRFWRRVVVEKPFGHSLDSARELNASILRTLGEDQIYRSTISLERTPSKTSWPSVSPMGCSSQSGIAIGSIVCRSPQRRRSASKNAASSMGGPGRYATWFPTTC